MKKYIATAKENIRTTKRIQRLSEDAAVDMILISPGFEDEIWRRTQDLDEFEDALEYDHRQDALLSEIFDKMEKGEKIDAGDCYLEEERDD